MRFCIGDFFHIRPRFERDQVELLEWTAKLHEVADAKAYPDRSFAPIKEKLLELGSGQEKIQKRGFQISDPFEADYEQMRIYPVTLRPEGAGFKDRMLFFDEHVSAIFEQMYPF